MEQEGTQARFTADFCPNPIFILLTFYGQIRAIKDNWENPKKVRVWVFKMHSCPSPFLCRGCLSVTDDKSALAARFATHCTVRFALGSCLPARFDQVCRLDQTSKKQKVEMFRSSLFWLFHSAQLHIVTIVVHYHNCSINTAASNSHNLRNFCN